MTERTPFLLNEGDLVSALADALGTEVARGRGALIDRGLSAERALGELDVAISRALALVRMSAPVLSKKTRRRIEAPLREAAKRFEARHQRGRGIVAWHELLRRQQLSEPSLTAAFEQTCSNQKLVPFPRAPIDGAVALFRDSLPSRMTTDDLRRGLRETYRKARAAFRRLQRVGDLVHATALSARSTDLGNQLELTSALSPTRATKWAHRFRQIATELDLALDLAYMRSAVAAISRERVDLDPLRKRNVERVIDTERAQALERASAWASRALSRKPQKFSSRFSL